VGADCVRSSFAQWSFPPSSQHAIKRGFFRRNIGRLSLGRSFVLGNSFVPKGSDADFEGRWRLSSYEARSLLRILDVPPPQRAELLSKQHAGLPAQPVMKVGDQAKERDFVGEAVDEVNARVHASITGCAVFADEERVVIERTQR